MIEELRKNIESEIQILREISAYSGRIPVAKQAEAKILSESIKSLTISLKIINSSLPQILKGVSVATKLPSKIKDTGLEKISFQRQNSELNVALKAEDRERFLNELSINEYLLKRVKRGVVVMEKQKDLKSASKYVKLSNKFFLNQANKYIEREYFKTLSRELKKANFEILLSSYVSMILFTSFISFFFGLFITAFLLFFNLGFSYPFLSAYSGSILTRLLEVFWIPIALPIATFAFLYYYPSTERSSIEKRIDQELPFAVIHMSAISGSGIEPSEIFRIIGLSKEYPYLRKEIRKVINQINLYGYDLVTALTNASKNSPSTRLSELFSGLATTINSGGDLQEFFEQRAETLLNIYRLDREKYTKVAETFMDIYISVVIAAPMILLLVIVMISVSGIQTGFSPNQLTFLIILAIALVNVLFIAFVHMRQPTY